MIAILDTHAIIWSLEDDPRLGSSARKMIAGAGNKDLGISDISLLEISMLITKKRIHLKTSTERYLNTITRMVNVVPINPSIATRAMLLPLQQSDPFDRVIVATAEQLQLPLLTRDQLIVSSALIETRWD